MRSSWLPSFPSIVLGNHWCVVAPAGDKKPSDGVRVVRLDESKPREFTLESTSDFHAVMMLSPDERRLFVGTPTDYGIYDLTDEPSLVYREEGFLGRGRIFAWSCNANWLAGGDNLEVELLAVGEAFATPRSKAPVRRFRLPIRGDVTALGFGADERRLYTVSGQSLRPGRPIAKRCSRRPRAASGRNMTPFEWDASLPDDKRRGEETFAGLGRPLLMLEEQLRKPQFPKMDPQMDGEIVYVVEGLPTLEGADANAQLTDAWKAWSDLGGIRPREGADHESHIVIRTGPVDGPGARRHWLTLVRRPPAGFWNCGSTARKSGLPSRSI